jgi:hypothetical protein
MVDLRTILRPTSLSHCCLSFDYTDNASVLSIGKRPDPPFPCAFVPSSVAGTTRPMRDDGWGGPWARVSARDPISASWEFRWKLWPGAAGLHRLLYRRHCSPAGDELTKRKLQLGATYP